MIRKCVVLIVLAVCVLVGCISAPKSPATSVAYDFGLPAVRLVPEGYGIVLALELKSPGWFDSPNVDYRLAYEDPLKRYEYAGSRWAANPGVLIAQSLRQHLGIAQAVAADCLLRVEIQEFSQVFDSPQLSHGVLQASAILVGQKRQFVADRQISIRRPAMTADADGGVKALVAASMEFGRQLSEWLQLLEKNQELKKCGLAKT